MNGLQIKLFLLKYAESKSPTNDNEDVIFISGGFTVERNPQNKPGRVVPINTVYKVNLKSSIMKVFSEFKLKRSAHQSTIIGDKMYSVGGFNGTYLVDTEIIPIK